MTYKKKVSVYVKGDRNSTAYYRIYQYLDNIDNLECKYHMMMSVRIHNKYMPISKQPIWIKILVFIHIYIRMLCALIRDIIICPDIIIIHRRIISRYMPLSYKILLRILKYKQVKIIWDFDDNITESRELSYNTFRLFSRLSDAIVVTHNFLKDLISKEYHHKVMIMPTTDGDMYKLFEKDHINDLRLSSFDKELKLVWVATSSNLKYLENIIPTLDLTANNLKCKNITLKLLVICDSPIQHDCKFLKIDNIKWTRDKAIEAMQTGHIGLMPLEDTPFTQGKGGFKLVQYMSIGLPCIGSNVGFNTYVLSNGAGILVNNVQDWENAIYTLSDKEVWKQYSQNAYNNWIKNFSYKENLVRWEQILNN